MTLPGDPVPNPDEIRRRLAALRDSLLVLHKALIDSERIEYERAFGTVESQNRLLQLLINDPWFAWLRPLSELIVLMDETLEAEEEELLVGGARETANQTRSLLKTSEEGDGFPRSYFEALQREPEVVLAHARVMKHLKGTTG